MAYHISKWLRPNPNYIRTLKVIETPGRSFQLVTNLSTTPDFDSSLHEHFTISVTVMTPHYMNTLPLVSLL